MAIKFKCACGATLMAKDDQAGKRTRCPTCQQVIAIPRPAAAPVPKEPELALTEEPERPGCPSCGAEMRPNALICPKCGHNMQTGGDAKEAYGETGPSVVLPIGKIIGIAVAVAALAAGWFFVVSPLLSGAKLGNAYFFFTEGNLDRALQEFEALKPKVGASDREKLALWIDQVRLEQKANSGQTLIEGREVTCPEVEMSVEQHGNSGGALLYQVTIRNLGREPLTLSLAHFYAKGIRQIKPVAEDHADNTLAGVVAPGQSRTGILAFRGIPASPVVRYMGGTPITYYFLSFNDGKRYVKRHWRV